MSCDIERVRWMLLGVIALAAFCTGCLALFVALCFASARSNAPVASTLVKRSAF
jgi:hypothetical protein